MASNTKIEWTDTTWNPQTGCTAVSAGCANCYAIRESHVHAGNTGKAGKRFKDLTVRQSNGRIGWTGSINFHEDRLTEPLSWTKPRRVFVNSMSDTFHEDVPIEWLDNLFAVTTLCPHITFQVLTKRPARMREYFTAPDVWERIARAKFEVINRNGWSENSKRGKRVLSESFRPLFGGARWGEPTRWETIVFPLLNVWLGTSVENQSTADERIPELVKVPAPVRFLSCEPLLGPVELMQWLDIASGYTCRFDEATGKHIQTSPTVWTKVEHPLYTELNIPEPPVPIHWVIVGGESGPNARVLHPEIVQALRDQCAAASVAFFFKQWGEWLPHSQGVEYHPKMMPTMRVRIRKDQPGYNYEEFWRFGKVNAGRLLDGVEHSAFPEYQVIIADPRAELRSGRNVDA